MNYITSTELSKLWGISRRRIAILASEGRIEGAKRYGKNWLFPDNVKKPTDGRTKGTRDEIKNFRCPIFEFMDEDSFYPPLNKEELTIKHVVEAVNRCRYEEAEVILGDLPDKATNKYIRIAALYCGCMCATLNCDKNIYFKYYGNLLEELSEDFPYKAEMEEYVHIIDASLGDNKYYALWPSNSPAYHWHKSFLSRLSNLSNLWLSTGERRPSKQEIAAAERNLLLVEGLGAPHDLQALHIYLGCAYAVEGMTSERDYHFIEALKLSEKYDMFFTIAVQYYYMRDEFGSAMSEFPNEFREKVKFLSDDMHERFIKFANAMGTNNFHGKISDSDYTFISYALQNVSNKEISKKLGISTCSVARRYSKIYDALGVESKGELVKLYKRG